MALFTVIKYVLAFAFAYIIFILFGGIIFTTRYENAAWHDMPISVLAFGDQMYGLWLLFTVVVAAIIILAAINEAKRNRALEN